MYSTNHNFVKENLTRDEQMGSIMKIHGNLLVISQVIRN